MILKGDPSFRKAAFDPGKLFQLFQRHRLLPLASEVLPLLDQEVRNNWMADIRRKTLRSLHLTARLGEITGRFEENEIQSIPLKGPLLAHRLFGSVTERHFSDLDILIPEGHIRRILSIMEEQGFSLVSPKPGLSDRKWAYYVSHKKHFGMVSREEGFMAEFHTGINNRDIIRKEKERDFWKNRVTVRLGEREYQCMDPEHTFLHLIVHGGLHQYRRLFWLRDVAEALRRWELDHARILQTAGKYELDRMLGLGLLLSRDLFQVEIPVEYKDFLTRNRSVLGRLEDLTMEMIEGPEFPTIRGKLRRHYSMSRIKPGIKHRAKILAGIFHRWYIKVALSG